MSCSNNKMVSICIPTYNGEKYLQEALDSVKKQTYQHIEVIISDDNSSDNTLRICEKFKKEVNFSVYIYHHVPSGIGANWNYSVQKAKGEYIKFLFQDDLLESNCLEKMIDVFNNNEGVQFVACKRNFINNNKSISDEEMSNWIKKYSNLQIQLEDLLDFESNLYYLNKNIFKRSDFFQSPLNKIGEPTTVMFKKEIMNSIGVFNNDLKQILDYEYWYRVLLKYKIIIINEPLVSFRIHDSQETNVNRNRIIKDYEKYEDFQLNKLFFYLNNTRKRKLLIKKYPILQNIFKLYYKIRY